MNRYFSRLSMCAVLAAAACSQAPSAPPKDRASTGPLLRLHGDQCYLIENAPEGYMRGNGSLFYVMQQIPALGHQSLPQGIVRGTTRVNSVLFVHWYCQPKQGLEPVLRSEGLPVKGVGQDETERLGKCIGKYKPLPNQTWSDAADAVDVRIELGHADGVRPGDRYVLLGAPTVEADRRVTGADVLGECIVQPLDLEPMVATCSVDRGTPEKAHAFTREQWEQGGTAVLRQDEVPRGTCP